MQPIGCIIRKRFHKFAACCNSPFVNLPFFLCPSLTRLALSSDRQLWTLAAEVRRLLHDHLPNQSVPKLWNNFLQS